MNDDEEGRGGYAALWLAELGATVPQAVGGRLCRDRQPAAWLALEGAAPDPTHPPDRE